MGSTTEAGTTRGGRHAGAAGFLAAALALAVAELVDALSAPAPSLIAVVGQAFIRRAPARFGRAAIEAVGTNDKPLVMAGTVVAALVLGTVVGWVPGASASPATSPSPPSVRWPSCARQACNRSRWRARR